MLRIPASQIALLGCKSNIGLLVEYPDVQTFATAVRMPAVRMPAVRMFITPDEKAAVRMFITPDKKLLSGCL